MVSTSGAASTFSVGQTQKAAAATKSVVSRDTYKGGGTV